MDTIKNYMMRKNGIMYTAVLIIMVAFSIMAPGFFSLANLKSVFLSMGLVCIMGCGITLVMTLGEIDISTGAMMSVTPVIIAVLVTGGVHVALALAVGIAVTLGLGFLNGFLVSGLGLPSFISTLGMYGICQGMTRIISNNTPIMMRDSVIIDIFGREIWGVPKFIIWMFVMMAVAFYILHKTKFGRNIQCIGDNRQMAILAGVDVKKNINLTFVTSSVFVIVAGLVELGRAAYASPGIGEALVLNVIVAAVIGGTSVSGGKGSILGTFIGALFLAVVANGLFIQGFSPWVSNITIGLIIIIILTVSGALEVRRKEMEHQ